MYAEDAERSSVFLCALSVYSLGGLCASAFQDGSLYLSSIPKGRDMLVCSDRLVGLVR